MSRCLTCGQIGGHARLVHRNQILADWWPLYRVQLDGHGVVRTERERQPPRAFVRAAEEEVDRQLGPNVVPGIR